MADVRLSVSGRRTVIEDIAFALFTGFDALFKDAVLVPELFDFLSLFCLQGGNKKSPRPEKDESLKQSQPPIQHTFICVPYNAGKNVAAYWIFGAQLIK